MPGDDGRRDDVHSSSRRRRGQRRVDRAPGYTDSRNESLLRGEKLKIFLFILFLTASLFAQPFQSPLILTDGGAVEVSRWHYSPCVSNPLLHSLNFGRNINTGNTGCNNLIVGNFETLPPVLTGLNNTLVGNSAGLNLTTGSANVFFGQSAGGGNKTGWYNVAIGQATGGWNYFGQRNIYIGFRAGSQQSNFGEFPADDNIFIGYEAGYQNQAGVRNTFIGNYAGRSSGSFDSVFIGYNAGRFETAGNAFALANNNGVLLTGGFSSVVNDQFFKVNGKLMITDFPRPKTCTKGTVTFDSYRLWVCVKTDVWKGIVLHTY